MAERKAVTRETAERYDRAAKREKGRILDELCALTGWSRGHARRALKAAAGRPWASPEAPRRGRGRTYGEEVLVPLRRIWAVLDGPCGKRLAPFLPEIVRVMERCGELDLTPEVREKLLRVSAATIDRLLAPDRRRLRVKGRSGTKPGSLLKHRIAIRTFAEWDEARPGFLEADLVAHDGGDPRGEFCQTLTLTCIASGWTELRALPNKAQRWVHEALGEVRRSLPFPLLGLDSDNGAEFPGDQLYRYCVEQGITFTRARPYRKNDSCFVEQKNRSVVRRQVGYLRYDTSEELAVLTELYGYLRLYVNFFQPQMKLLEKTREGAKVRRRYDEARTPYQRLLGSPHLSAAAKAALTRTYRRLNPLELKRAIAKCQDQLIRISRRKGPRKEVRPPLDHPWRTSQPRQRTASSRTS
jgi:hypothetical protein